MSDVVKNRYDFVYLFDCQDGNPNGDPDADNSPRFDPETFQGLVSDVCLKRKVRDYVLHSQAEAEGLRIFVVSGNTLESRQRLPYEELGLKAGKDAKTSDVEQARAWMCTHFYDVRAFGAVMSTTEFNCGQVRGPIQVTFSRSIDRIFTTEHTITRQAFTGEKDVKQGSGTMGRKHTIAYGLYRTFGFVNPVFANKTRFIEDDLAIFWNALRNMFDIDHSAARGLMSGRALIVFKHDSSLGSAPAHELFDSVKVRLKEGVSTPRSFADYEITMPDASALPEGVTMITPWRAAAAV